MSRSFNVGSGHYVTLYSWRACQSFRVTVRTLQYYDRKGLLTAERATESNRRYYNDDHIQQLQLIFLLKQFGCTLDEIKTLLYEDSDMQTLKAMLQLHKKELEQAYMTKQKH